MPRPLESDGRSLFVAWVRFQRRPLALQALFGFELHFLPVPEVARVLKLVVYAWRSLQTLHLLLRKKPDVLWLQLPQAPLLATALRYRRWFRGSLTIVADCHNSIFMPPWSRWPRLVVHLNRTDIVLVHTQEVVGRARRMGVQPARLRVLGDAPVDLRPGRTPEIARGGPFLLFMTTFVPEEPIDVLLEAARLAPELRFVVTGDARRARGRHELTRRPLNVEFAGYLKLEELDATVLAASVVLGLTRNRDEQLSSAAEGVSAGKPLVLSDTPTLRALYPLGAVFVDVEDPESIAAGCRRAMVEAERLAAETESFQEVRAAQWRREAERLHEEMQRLKAR